MKMPQFLHGKKFRYGSVSVALTVVIVAAVILFNAAFTALARKNLWYIDMTPEPRFTLSDAAKTYLDGLDADKEVVVQFCDSKDAWESNSTQREVLKTVEDMAKEHSNIKLEFINIYANPTAVAGYSERTGKAVTTQNVIIKSGTEVRMHALKEFFTFDSTQQNITGYNGEQIIVSSMLAVTQAEMPLLCATNNHGEQDLFDADNGVLFLMEQIGFKIQYINLELEEIPADCRLLLVYGPTRDFLERSATSDVSEIDKLEAYLAGNRSMMIFFNDHTPKLPNLEQFLGEWGIAIARKTDETYQVQDLSHSQTVDGRTLVATYSEGGTGADITAQLRASGYPKTVVFPNATALQFSDLYTVEYVESDVAYNYARYSKGAVSRLCYKVFESSTDATARAGGLLVDKEEDERYNYMLLACQSVDDFEYNRTRHSFILASSSTAFASSAAVDSRYGNRTVLSYACNVMGSLSVPVSIDCKYYASTDIVAMTTKAANQYTAVLALLPALTAVVVGVVVLVRRKYA